MTTDVLSLECTTDEMAEVLGVHTRSLQKLERDGWIAGKVGHNRWNLARTVQSYRDHLILEQRVPRTLGAG